MMTDISLNPNVPSLTQIAQRFKVTPPVSFARYDLISDSIPATKFIHPDNSALTAPRKLCPTNPISSSPVRLSPVAIKDCRDLYNNPGSAREYKRDIIGAGRVVGRVSDFSWSGK